MAFLVVQVVTIVPRRHVERSVYILGYFIA